MARPIETILYKGRRVTASQYIEGEHGALKDEVHSFHSDFSRLETALANLLHAILNAANSSVPFAIYYSPTSFDARVEMVSNALIELATETPKLQRLLQPPRWPYVEGKIDSIRRARNAIAHGSSQVLLIRNKTHVRSFRREYGNI